MDDEEQYVKGFGIESQDGRVFDVTKAYQRHYILA